MQLLKITKEFIEENKNIIEAEDWTQLYNLTYSHNVDVGNLTEALYAAGLNPLEGQSSIPPHFLEYTKETTTFRVPEGISVISYNAFAYSQLQDIYLPEGVGIIDDEAFAGTKLDHLILPKTCKIL